MRVMSSPKGSAAFRPGVWTCVDEAVDVTGVKNIGLYPD